MRLIWHVHHPSFFAISPSSLTEHTLSFSLLLSVWERERAERQPKGNNKSLSDSSESNLSWIYDSGCYRYCITAISFAGRSGDHKRERKHPGIFSLIGKFCYTFPVCFPPFHQRISSLLWISPEQTDVRTCPKSYARASNRTRFKRKRKRTRSSANRCFTLQKRFSSLARRALHPPVYLRVCVCTRARAFCTHLGRARGVYVHICIHSGDCPLQNHLRRAFMVFSVVSRRSRGCLFYAYEE